MGRAAGASRVMGKPGTSLSRKARHIPPEDLTRDHGDEGRKSPGAMAHPRKIDQATRDSGDAYGADPSPAPVVVRHSTEAHRPRASSHLCARSPVSNRRVPRPDRPRFGPRFHGTSDQRSPTLGPVRGPEATPGTRTSVCSESVYGRSGGKKTLDVVQPPQECARRKNRLGFFMRGASSRLVGAGSSPISRFSSRQRLATTRHSGDRDNGEEG